MQRRSARFGTQNVCVQPCLLISMLKTRLASFQHELVSRSASFLCIFRRKTDGIESRIRLPTASLTVYVGCREGRANDGMRRVLTSSIGGRWGGCGQQLGTWVKKVSVIVAKTKKPFSETSCSAFLTVSSDFLQATYEYVETPSYKERTSLAARCTVR